MKSRRLKPLISEMFETVLCRLDTVPPVDGYGKTAGLARAHAVAKAEAAGHKLLIRHRGALYVLEVTPCP